jgi:hypothetical protein
MTKEQLRNIFQNHVYRDGDLYVLKSRRSIGLIIDKILALQKEDKQPEIDKTELALKISYFIHNECKDVPHDIGLQILNIIYPGSIPPLMDRTDKQPEITDEDIEKWAEKEPPLYADERLEYFIIKGRIEGAKAMRDELIPVKDK